MHFALVVQEGHRRRQSTCCKQSGRHLWGFSRPPETLWSSSTSTSPVNSKIRTHVRPSGCELPSPSCDRPYPVCAPGIDLRRCQGIFLAVIRRGLVWRASGAPPPSFGPPPLPPSPLRRAWRRASGVPHAGLMWAHIFVNGTLLFSFCVPSFSTAVEGT